MRTVSTIEIVARQDLQHSDEQWYWNDATRDNVDAIIRERAEQFVASHGALQSLSS